MSTSSTFQYCSTPAFTNPNPLTPSIISFLSAVKVLHSAQSLWPLTAITMPCWISPCDMQCTAEIAVFCSSPEPLNNSGKAGNEEALHWCLSKHCFSCVYIHENKVRGFTLLRTGFEGCFSAEITHVCGLFFFVFFY